MDGGRLRSIHTHPVKGEPGTDLDVVQVGVEGLEGDRRKKAPVHVVTTAEAEGLRANFVVDADSLPGAGTHLVVGEVELAVTGPAKNCPGVYADVVRPGRVSVGDAVVALAGEV